MVEWTPEKEEQIKQLYLTAGLSGSQIAAELGEGVSRSAVMGKLSRLGLKKGKPPAKPRVGKISPPKIHRPKIRIQKVKVFVPPAPTTAPEPTGPRGLLPAIESLQAGFCKSPVGDPSAADFGYCNAPTDGGPYCAFHTKLHYHPSSRKQRAP